MGEGLSCPGDLREQGPLMNNKNLGSFMLGVCALVGLVMAQQTLAATRYVTDELEVTMRSGQSTRNNIVRMLKSGTAMEVLQDDPETGYSLVRLPSGTEGWVLTRFLVDQPVARDVLPELQRRYTALRESASGSGVQLEEARDELAKLRKERDALTNENEQLARQLHDVQEKAADVLGIDAQNSNLRKRVTVLEGENDQLRILNDELSNRRTLEWFMAGGGVLFFGLLLGLILPRIRWRRRSSWGDL
jgi:SH3 domain protein